MKLFIIGSDKSFAIENFYVRYLDALGARVFVFAAQTIFSDYYQRNLLNKVLFRTGLSTIYRTINTIVKEQIEIEEPDIVWVFKGMEIYPDTLKWIRRKGIKLVNYNPDNPFLFSGKGSGNANITRSIGMYDMHFTYDRLIKDRLSREFHARTRMLPFGFDLSDELYEECAGQQEIGRACFLGNPDVHRAAFLKVIAGDLPLDVYGHHWKRFLDHPNVRICEPVYRDDLWKTLRRYRCQINLMRPHNPQSHNMRSFEVPGVGGILLAPDTEDHKTFFTPGKELFLYQDAASCIEQAKYLLSISAEEANEIRANARRRSLESGYSYRSRAREAFVQMNELLNGKN